MKIILLFFLLPLHIFAQDITGVWTGTLYNDTTKQFIKYELTISEYNGKLSGYSHTIFEIDSVENIGVKSVKIKKSGQEFLLEDDKLIYNNYTEPPAKGVRTYSDLVLSQNDSAMILSGRWNTNKTKVYKELTGDIFLQKKKQIGQTLIIPKLETLGLARSLSFITSPTQANNLAVIHKRNINPINSKEQRKDIAKSAGVGIETSEIDENQKSIAQEEELPKSKDGFISKPLGNEKATATEEKFSQNNETVVVSFKNESQINKESEKIVAKIDGPESKIEENVLDKKMVGDTLSKEKIAQKKYETNSISSKAKIQQPAMELVADKKTLERALKKDSIERNKVVLKAPAAEIANRKIETIRSVEVKNDSLVLTLYDNGEIDGDTVSVLLNGKVIMPMQGLMSRAINKTIYLTPEMGDSIVLIMYAENLGSIPPNTGLLVVHDGDDVFEIRFAGDLQKNSAIILKRKKKQ